MKSLDVSRDLRNHESWSSRDRTQPRDLIDRSTHKGTRCGKEEAIRTLVNDKSQGMEMIAMDMSVKRQRV